MMDGASSPAVAPSYRGVWQRTLLSAPGMYDTGTLVLWLQTQRWHADLRIPADRPDFSGTRSLAACSRAQLAWLARQQGFAGTTTIDATPEADICRWHRKVDYQPPLAMPDAGYLRCEAEHLVETGVYADYLEHWRLLPGSHDGFAVLRRRDAQRRRHFLMVAGDCVMHVRERDPALASALQPGADMRRLDDATLRAVLDCEISFGMRTPEGWVIRHSTLPWLERSVVSLTMLPVNAASMALVWNGERTHWQICEWAPPSR